MATNKNAQLRYQVLDRCFSDFGHYYTFDNLRQEVNEVLNEMYATEVSVRQLRDDIAFMRDSDGFNAPIEVYPYEGNSRYYRYSDRHFSIFKNELSVKEVETLRSTIEMLRRFRGIQGNGWLEEVISNLECRFGVKGSTENIVSFEQNEKLQGLDHLSTLIDATATHHPLRIFYRPFHRDPYWCIVHPYHLKQYNNRWFLFCHEEGRKPFISNKALDRIVTIEPSSVKYIPNTEVDFSSYFKEIIGVSVPDSNVPLEDVVMRFDPKRFPYVVNKPLHPSQEIIDEESCTLKIKVRYTKELEAKILFYGSQVEVLQPAHLRQRIAAEMEHGLEKYNTVQDDCTPND